MKLIRNPFVLPLLFALLAGGAVFLALSKPSTPAPATPVETQRVAVAARALDTGAPFRPEDFTIETVANRALPDDAVRDASDLRGAFAAVPVVKGDVVRRSSISTLPPGSRLAAVIPEGSVAISIAVSDVVTAGGFIVPGDRVDILGVVTKEAMDTAIVVLRDVQVLAVSNNIVGANPVDDAKKKPGNNDSPQAITSTVTLAVTIQEAQRLVQVDENGKLRLALRRRGLGNPSAAVQRP